MKTLQDCTYSAFISYAHADDDLCMGWISDFRKELDTGLRARLRGVNLPGMHLSGENGPVAGMLSDELRRRIEASFAMIIVVHENYAQSDWCLKELSYFKSLFGERGFRERLYIVALAEEPMLRVSRSPGWKSLLPEDDQIWTPFFDRNDRSRYLDIYTERGPVSPAFRQPFENLRDSFADRLKQAVRVPPGISVTRLPETPAVPPPRPDDAARPAGQVLFGFVPPDSAEATQRAAGLLAQRGLAARVLSQDVVFTDFADFAKAEHLVLAFDDTPLMLTSLAAGGHLELQRDAWSRRGGSASALHWLDLRTAPGAPPQGAAAWVAAQGLAPVGAQALADRLRPPADPQPPPPPLRGVRIYIESNQNELTLWDPLGDQIRRKWDEVCRLMAPGQKPPLSLRARALPVDQLDAHPPLDDADGVVLLWGRKTSEALVAQINKVENKMTPGRDAAPGIVAYLMPPQQSAEPVPAWGWQVLRFNAATEDAIDVVSEETDQLERFLKKIFRRRQQLDAAAGTP